jgi:non-homologous end joining protein Ku
MLERNLPLGCGVFPNHHGESSCVMAPRANWKGYLKLSLVSCAVALFPATSTRDRVRFAAPKSTALKRAPAKRKKIKRAS